MVFQTGAVVQFLHIIRAGFYWVGPGQLTLSESLCLLALQLASLLALIKPGHVFSV